MKLPLWGGWEVGGGGGVSGGWGMFWWTVWLSWGCELGTWIGEEVFGACGDGGGS